MVIKKFVNAGMPEKDLKTSLQCLAVLARTRDTAKFEPNLVEVCRENRE